MTAPVGDRLVEFTERLRGFVEARGWGPFQTPKNLAMALGGETGELLAELQWLTPDQAAEVMSRPEGEGVRDEMADVFIYLIRLADVYGVDLIELAEAKMAKNAVKYPAPDQ